MDTGRKLEFRRWLVTSQNGATNEYIVIRRDDREALRVARTDTLPKRGAK